MLVMVDIERGNIFWYGGKCFESRKNYEKRMFFIICTKRPMAFAKVRTFKRGEIDRRNRVGI